MNQRRLALLSVAVVLTVASAWSLADFKGSPLDVARLSGVLPPPPKLVTGDYILESPDPMLPSHPIRIEQLRLEVDGQKITGGRYTLTDSGKKDDPSIFSGEWAAGTASIVLLHQQTPDGYHVFWTLQSTGDVWAGTWIDSDGHNGTVKLARKKAD